MLSTVLNNSHKDHVSDEDVHRKIQADIQEYDKLLTLVKKRKLGWFCHITMSSGVAEPFFQGTVKGRRGRQNKSGQRWTLAVQIAQMTIGLGGEELLQCHLLCPNDLARLWERLD